jgi:hypothetical protein
MELEEDGDEEDLKLKYGEPDDLYDATSDDLDLKHVLQTKVVADSDAVLSCPMCFTVVCYDCQRMEGSTSQFRAMFVEHLTVLRERPAVDVIPALQDNPEQALQLCNDKGYLKACCDQCYSVLAVVDREEVYHLFNVIVSPVPKAMAVNTPDTATTTDKTIPLAVQ